MEDSMIYNALQCLECNSVVESLHRHDYRHCKCGNISNDGGSDYIHCSWKEGKMEDNIISLALYSYSPIEQVREKLKRWNNREKKWVLLKDIDGGWLDAIILYYLEEGESMSNKFLLQYIKEKQFRNEL